MASIVCASLLLENYDLRHSGELSCVLVLVAPRESTTGSGKAALTAFVLTVLLVPRRWQFVFFEQAAYYCQCGHERACGHVVASHGGLRNSVARDAEISEWPLGLVLRNDHLLRECANRFWLTE